MAKQILVTCINCKKKIDRDSAFKVGDKSYYCDETCHKEKLNSKKTKLTQDQEERKELISYIKDLYDGNIPTMVFAQIKRYYEKGMKYKGMLLTLKYIYEHDNRVFDDNNGIGLIEWYYDKAKENYVDMIRIKNKIKTFEEDNDVKIVKKHIDISRKIKYNKKEIEF